MEFKSSALLIGILQVLTVSLVLTHIPREERGDYFSHCVSEKVDSTK